MQAATQGSIAILAPGNTLLTRIWCMYECWASVYYGNAQRLQVLFPRSVDLADLSQFQDMCKELDLTRCEASRPVDKQKIVSEAKHAVRAESTPGAHALPARGACGEEGRGLIGGSIL